MLHFKPENYSSWERIYRANFFNSLNGFKNVCLIGTSDKNGRTNLGVFSNLVHLGADPALVGFVNRPREAAPHTLANIEATGSYTINHIRESFLRQAHQCSAKYPAEISEFEATSLTPCYEVGIHAPFVAESRVRYAVDLKEIIPIRHNGTYFVIGAVTDVFLAPDVIENDGYIVLEKAGSLVSLGLDGYYSTQRIQRLPYARPTNPTHS